MLNPRLSLIQPKSLSLLFPLNPSISDPWPPSVTTHRKAPHNRSKPARLISTYTANCVKKSRSSDLRVAAPIEVSVKATVTVYRTDKGTISRVSDEVTDWFLLGKSLRLELVSAEIDPKTSKQWDHISTYADHKMLGKKDDDEAKYEATFKVPIGFGEVGAILVENEHRKEMFIKNIELVTDNDDSSKISFFCDSWVHSKFDNPEKRIFFSVKSYLPSQTPQSLVDLRRKDLESLRGDGTGERKKFDRIYDYDVYNDLGEPDKDADMARPVLGGSKQFPYPRRCRTGGASTKDGLSEKRKAEVYVPRDERFSDVKEESFQINSIRSVLKHVVPKITTALGVRDEAIDGTNNKQRFPYFTAIETLYDEGVKLPPQKGVNTIFNLIPRLIKNIKDSTEMVLLFETPELIDRDKFAWFRDEEFSRQCLAGLNPYSIKLLTELPIVSKLDPAIYGSPDSLITPELIEREIKGAMTAQEAIKQKKLFMLDYHDLLLPYVHKVRELDYRTLYGSRTVFFLTDDGTLMPIAIELTRPASPTKPQWRQVFTDNWDATSAWLWKLAKIHVSAHDTGYHQLVSHWLRTHCCIEPYIIAAHRQLSAMHPIYRLLHPHFRYTMEINANARESLISAANPGKSLVDTVGIIERTFAPGKYSLELSSVAYGLEWRFDMEALPADLIRRGMAVEDPTEKEHGLRLTIEDYPFANDGLLIWKSIKEWVTDYVNHYYKTPTDVLQDSEIQEWWLEIRTKGHADKKDEPWWPKLENQDDLIQILTTIMWVTSGHHAAVNFGQYHYAGYFPNRPTIARRNMPNEEIDENPNSESYAEFWRKPEDALMDCFPSQAEATLVMAILDVLSTHSSDEEYIGEKAEPVWKSDPVINAAFERFNGRMHEIEGIIDARNSDPKLMNRCGAGIVPYELLKPFSHPGVTGKGIPNSISI